MSLKRRVEKIEKVAGPVEELEGPINITEWMSGEIDEGARRKLGRVGIRDAVLRFRESLARIDWDIPDTDDFGNPITSKDPGSMASDNPESGGTST